MSDSSAAANTTGIAVVGMAGRFPRAGSVSEFWQNLSGGVEAISFFSEQELEAAGVPASQLKDPKYVRAKAVLDDVELFDASFFGFNPREAELTDPQHRLFLECAWESLEAAGYDPKRYEGAIAVYAGVSLNTYLLVNLMSNRDLIESLGFLQASIRNRTDHLTTNVSYKLDLKGPSVTVQTACSTSLVAVHLACQSLLHGECDMALAGGASVSVPQKSGYAYQEGGIFSPDGHCRAFDAAAQGTVNGDGVGVVVLKRLEDALADGDQIHAVIRGSAVNNDGSLKVGYTAPSVEGQAQVIAEAQAVAGVEAESIGYVEAHGTGTVMGDPIEVAALTQVFRESTAKKNFCALGSVKTNVGHLDAAAGVTGLIKTVLALEHKTLPPSLHFEQPNPGIDFAASPFYVNARAAEWEADAGRPRRAGVSSFGIGGTNAHVIVEEAPAVGPSGATRPWQVLLLSAKTSTALEAATANLSERLAGDPGLNIADVAYTLGVGRGEFNFRRAVVCNGYEDAVRQLETLDPRRVHTGFQEPKERPVVFMFPGQGSQYVQMGRGLYETEPTFREQVDLCAGLLQPHLGFDLRDVLYPDESQTGDAAQPLTQTYITQPALFVIEYALAQLWMSWGVRPHAMIGHSIGEYVAACLAGVMTLEEALALVAARGRLIQSLPGGAMLVVPLPEQEVLPLLAGRQLSMAAVNGPALCVVSGVTEDVEWLERELTQKGAACRRLHTSHAFHSEMMEPILEQFGAEVRRVGLRAPQIPYLSNVTGTWVTEAETTSPDYWVNHVRQTVRFDAGVRAVLKEWDWVLLEVGPGRMLSTLARWNPFRASGQVVLNTLRHPEDQQPDEAFLHTTLGKLWLLGIRFDWEGYYRYERRLRLPLPTYPFERQRYWIEAQKSAPGEGAPGASLKKRADVAEWFYVPSWKRTAHVARVEPSQPPDEGAGWLVFVDETGFGARLVERLKGTGQEVFTVAAGQRFAAKGGRAYELNPSRREDYDALLKELRASAGALPRTIVHLWNVAPPDGSGADPAADARTLGRQLERSFYSLLYLAQAVGAEGVTEPLRLNVVSAGVYGVTGGEALHPVKATLLGPCRVIPQEYSNISCRQVDLDLEELAGARGDRLLDRLVSELAAAAPEPVVAYRGTHRWAQGFEPLRMEAPGETGGRPRERGVYLITGGMGGIGLTVAEHLAQTCRARLVLVGRSALPERDEWERWLETHDEQDATSFKLRRLQALEAMGAEVLALSADVSDERQMRSALARARERFGPVNGVVHSAGVPGGGVIQLKTPEAAEAVFAPKVAGALVLGSLLADTPLDFFLLCSSRSAILGGFGQVDYCAANSFLDAFAHHHAERTGAYTVSVNWDAWHDVGMLADSAALYGAGRGDRRPVESRRTEHPLLDTEVTDSPEHEVYQTEISPLTHWMLDEHRIVGNAVVPGTAYLEMARAAAARHAPAGTIIEIRDAFFLAPLGLRDDEKRTLRTVVERSGDSLEFHVFGSPKAEGGGRGGAANGHEAKWQEYALGKVGYVEADDEPRRHDLKAIIERCNVRHVVLHDEYKRDEDLGPRWQALKRVYLGHNELLAKLELPEQFADELDTLKLHPALLDRATGTGKEYLIADGVYMPMGYRRLRIRRPLTRSIYTHIKFRDNENDKRQTIAFDVLFTDEHGEELVEIEAFTQKRVNDIAGQIKALSKRKYRRAEDDGGAEATAAAAPAPAEDLIANIYQRGLSEGIAPREGADAFSRILAADAPPQVVVSTKDLQASVEQAAAHTRLNLTEEIGKLHVARPAHARPSVQTPFTGATDDLERIIAEIWQDMLGIEQVGIHDNFFELGGDSVQAIQIISRINQHGLQLTPQQLFQNQTVAELAAVARTAQAVHAEQGEVTGPLPLTPVQRRFFDEQHPDPSHYNQAVMLETVRPLDPALMGTLTETLLRHHDALRTRFEQTPDGWQQYVAPFDGAPPFERVDLSRLPEDEQRREVERRAAESQTTLDLTGGPALRLVHFDLGEGRPGRLLIVVHYLVTDGVSLRVLLEDIQTVYGQLAGGEAVRLNPKTTSYQYWARRLEEYAGSEALRRELDYWLAESRTRVAPLPTDGAGGDAPNEEASVRSVSVSLEAAETQSLLQEAPQAYHTQINEVLLAALALAAARWAGTPSLLVELEGHGREDLFPEADVSRTVGAFTTLTPVLLEIGERADLASALKSVKEQVRRAPRHGIGYGLLRYMSADAEARERLAALPRPEVRFNYLGQVDQLFAESQLFRPAHEAIGPAHSPRSRRGHLLEINAMISEGRLRMEWNYSEHLQRRETVEHLAGLYVEELRALIAHCLSPESGDFTPSDFPLANLDEAQLDKLALILEESDVDESGAGVGHVAEEAGRVASNGERAHQLSKVEEVLRQHPSVRNSVVVEREDGPGGGGLVAYVELDPRHAAAPAGEMDFSLFYFADDDTEAGSDKYRLLVEGAKFADRHGFKAVWTPERHFHEKAGLYPNPSVLSAALAMVTERLHLRAGSVALPLHNPLRVAEEWAVADNLSGGRVGVSFTSGWVPNDFAFFPERFAVKKDEMFRLLGEVQRLWRGEPVTARDGVGNEFEARVFPRPVQPELPVWLTCSGGPDMFRKAGELGVNVLTALLAQSVEEAAGKIKLYRDALAEHGHDPASGRVTMMIHTFLGADPAQVLERVRAPLTNYLRSHVSLIETYAKSMDIKVGMEREQWVEALVGFAFERYYRTASLIGTPQTCLPMIERLRAIGVDEVACLIDFGVETETVLDSLAHLDALRELARPAPAARASVPSPGRADTDALAGFLKERLPGYPTPSSFVFMNSLPVTPEGEVNRRVLPSPQGG